MPASAHPHDGVNSCSYCSYSSLLSSFPLHPSPLADFAEEQLYLTGSSSCFWGVYPTAPCAVQEKAWLYKPFPRGLGGKMSV